MNERYLHSIKNTEVFKISDGLIEFVSLAKLRLFFVFLEEKYMTMYETFCITVLQEERIAMNKI